MTNPLGNQQNGPAPAAGGTTEFERSIGRSADISVDASPGLREQIEQDVDAAKKVAENATQRVTEKATEVAERQKGYAADQISKLAEALEKVGGELQSQQKGPVADYTKRLGTSARQFAEQVNDKDMGEIAALAEDFGRRQPLAFLGLAAIAGFAASRFMMASSPRQANTAKNTQNSGGSNQAMGTKETYNG